jgi:hypothetical protein
MTMPKRVPPGTAPRHRYLVLASALGLMSLLAAGCADEGHSPSGSGGFTGAGSGGAPGSGGSTAGGSGGSGTGSGGALNPGTGGSASGGAGTGSGGATAGSGGAGTGSGGSGTGSGGSAAASGGRAGTGGASGTGGRAAGSGGSSIGSGGASATGGAPGSGGSSATGGAGGTAAANPMMNFFVTSETSTTANLGGLAGADMRCQRLAAAVGAGSKTWRAYLSAATPATNAIDRIGPGPYYNSAGAMVAADKAALHARAGDAALFITERGARINGQWMNSPTPIEHDILTGTLRDGTIATGNTCGDWTATTGSSQVGHSDGFGPGMSTTGSYSYWNAAHVGQCGNTAPGGGAGRIYCFVGP